MRLAKAIDKTKDKVAVSVWSRTGKLTKEGKQSKTFTVEDTTMDELSESIKRMVEATEHWRKK